MLAVRVAVIVAICYAGGIAQFTGLVCCVFRKFGLAKDSEMTAIQNCYEQPDTSEQRFNKFKWKLFAIIVGGLLLNNAITIILILLFS